MKTSRVVFLEILNQNRLKIRRNEFFPFLQAAFRASGMEVARFFVGVEDPEPPKPYLVYSIPEEDEERVLSEICAFSTPPTCS